MKNNIVGSNEVLNKLLEAMLMKMAATASSYYAYLTLPFTR